jgi:hypothetical protein
MAGIDHFTGHKGSRGYDGLSSRRMAVVSEWAADASGKDVLWLRTLGQPGVRKMNLKGKFVA